MDKSKTIISILIIITLIIGLSVFIVIKNKKVYITNINDLDNIKISMLKIENGVTSVIKEVPTIGDWKMTYTCDDETIKIYWNEENKKLQLENIKSTECIIKFEESISLLNVVSIYVDDVCRET